MKTVLSIVLVAAAITAAAEPVTVGAVNCGSFHYPVRHGTAGGWAELAKENPAEVFFYEDAGRTPFPQGAAGAKGLDIFAAVGRGGASRTQTSVVELPRTIEVGGVLRRTPRYRALRVVTDWRGKRLAFFGLHLVAEGHIKAPKPPKGELSFSQKLRQRQFAALIAEAAKYDHAVLCGDFNAQTPAEYEIFTKAGFTIANCSGRYGTRATLRNIPADNIILSPGLELIDFRVLDTYALDTDHYPIVAKFDLKSSVAAAWPAVTGEMKPWVYNWWMGSAVDAEGLEYQCRELVEKGFGGFHVIPIYGAKGYEAKYRGFLSPGWVEAWNLAALKAREHGLGIDLTMGSGWCFGGPWIGKEDAASSGMRVKRAGPGGEGYMIDPYSPAAMSNHVARFEAAFGRNGTAMRPRAFYHDSYEYYRAMPKHGEDPHEAMVSTFSVWADWCRANGYLTRNEAHGSPVNWLDLYALADIPETEMFAVECRDVLVSKFASSAAHVKGSRLVSAESCTWLAENFTGTLADAKRFLDRLFLAGVNHVFYHGCCYSPVGAVWPGWCFYAAFQMNPRNPIWHDAGALNAYVTRCQSMFQTWESDNDLALVWDRNGTEMMSVHNPESWFYPTKTGRLAKELHAAGYQFDYVSPKMLAERDLARYAEIIDAGKGETPSKARRSPFTGFEGIASTRWRRDGETAYFVVNGGGRAAAVSAGGAEFTVMDPMTGDIAAVGSFELGPGQAAFFIGERAYSVGEAAAVPRAAFLEVAGPWKLVPVCGGPEMPAPREMASLSSWSRDADGSENAFCGTMKYRAVFGLKPGRGDGASPAASANDGVLDLGEVHESARVRLNGVDLGCRFFPPYRFTVPKGALKNLNEIEIEVTNTGANRIRWNDRTGVDWKRFHDINFISIKGVLEHTPAVPFDASTWPLRPAGLLGPVRLVPRG